MQCLRQTAPVLSATRPAGRAFTPVVAKADTRRARTAEKHARLRRKLSGTPERPRLAVFKSNEHMYAQVIDDSVGHTLVHTSTLHKDVKEGLPSTANIDAAAVVGKKVAELCLAKNITTVAFDRGGFAYHGRIKAVADAARAAGLVF